MMPSEDAAGDFIRGVLEGAVAASPLPVHFEHDASEGGAAQEELGKGE